MEGNGGYGIFNCSKSCSVIIGRSFEQPRKHPKINTREALLFRAHLNWIWLQ
jgi:hypothetical protein